MTAWREQRHAFDDVQIHTAGAGSHTSAGGYGNEAARASSHLTLPQQPPAAPPVGAGAAAATSAAEDHKRALVNALQKDIYDLTLAQMADPPLIVRLIMRIADFAEEVARLILGELPRYCGVPRPGRASALGPRTTVAGRLRSP